MKASRDPVSLYLCPSSCLTAMRPDATFTEATSKLRGAWPCGRIEDAVSTPIAVGMIASEVIIDNTPLKVIAILSLINPQTFVHEEIDTEIRPSVQLRSQRIRDDVTTLMSR